MTSENPTRIRRLRLALVLFLAAWLGVTFFVWFSASATFSVLTGGGSPALSERFEKIPKAERAKTLRMAGGEVNRRMFRGWNWAQLLAAVLSVWAVLGLKRGEGDRTLLLWLAGVLLAVVLAHAFWLGPGIERTGRELAAGGSGAADAARRFGIYHGVYIVSDMLKAVFLAFALWLGLRGLNRGPVSTE